MTANELVQICRDLYGTEHWHALLASAVGVHRTTVWRWSTGEKPVPKAVEALLLAWVDRGESRSGGNRE